MSVAVAIYYACQFKKLLVLRPSQMPISPPDILRCDITSGKYFVHTASVISGAVIRFPKAIHTASQRSRFHFYRLLIITMIAYLVDDR